ncbi:peptidoglycan-binding domain-containing protein [Streptomyces sp. CA-181903]|uniref:peptidoglycan-binding domain-containing protein n=1 Tax=Streptomyces sp. CA-181903 TaxID=3240055 RepID=UPI003D914576
MRPNVLTRALVGITAVAGLAAGSLATAGTGFAAAQPATSSQSVSILAVNNLGLNASEAKNVQRWAKQYWSYRGELDGQLGTESWKAIQRCLKEAWGYKGEIDGIVGSGTLTALQYMLRDGGWGYSGRIDGIAGPKTTAAFKNFANGI